MNMKNIYLLSLIIVLVITYMNGYAQLQTDTIKAPNAKVKPVIDGKADDACWNDPVWHNIDQVWIPYGATMKEDDFSGKFAMAWDSLYLYVLVQVIDGFMVGRRLCGIVYR